MKHTLTITKTIRTFVIALALSISFFAVSAQAETALTAKVGAAAEASTPPLKLSGMGDNAPGCLPERQLDPGECKDIADEVGEEMHSGVWAWAPKGCHFNTKHGSMWFNAHPTGSTDNTNYTSVCKPDVAAVPEGSEFCGPSTGWDSDKNTCIVAVNLRTHYFRFSGDTATSAPLTTCAAGQVELDSPTYATDRVCGQPLAPGADPMMECWRRYRCGYQANSMCRTCMTL